jgi:hypothetical protein
MDARRHEILRRLNAFDVGPTEDARRAERRAEIRRAIQTEQDLKWGRLSAGMAGGVPGRSYPCSVMRAQDDRSPLGTTRRNPKENGP